MVRGFYLENEIENTKNNLVLGLSNLILFKFFGSLYIDDQRSRGLRYVWEREEGREKEGEDDREIERYNNTKKPAWLDFTSML